MIKYIFYVSIGRRFVKELNYPFCSEYILKKEDRSKRGCPDSLVFVDDNLAERHIAEAQISGVKVPEVQGFTKQRMIQKEIWKGNLLFRKSMRKRTG